jgi:hypothetical protein
VGINDLGHGLKTLGLGEDFKEHSIGDRKGIQSTYVAAIRTELPYLCSQLSPPLLITELGGGDKSDPRSAASLIHRTSPCFLRKVAVIDVLATGCFARNCPQFGNPIMVPASSSFANWGAGTGRLK